MQKLADTFWNIRGVFRVVGINIGTHMSVVKRGNGRFVIIDGCELDDAQRAELLALTGNGEKVDAVLHVHPIHTMYVQDMHTKSSMLKEQVKQQILKKQGLGTVADPNAVKKAQTKVRRLQRDIHRPAEELRVSSAPRGVHDVDDALVRRHRVGRDDDHRARIGRGRGNNPCLRVR